MIIKECNILPSNLILLSKASKVRLDKKICFPFINLTETKFKKCEMAVRYALALKYCV